MKTHLWHKKLTGIFLFFLFIPNIHAAAEESAHLLFDGRAWKIGYEAHNESQAITEYVMEGETVENWTELVTAHRFLGLQNQITLKSFMEIMQRDLYKTCPSTRWEIISETPKELIYTWQIVNCPDEDNQYEIARLILGKEAIHLVRYTHKASALDAERYEVWMSLLKSAEIRTGSELDSKNFSEDSALKSGTK